MNWNSPDVLIRYRRRKNLNVSGKAPPGWESEVDSAGTTPSTLTTGALLWFPGRGPSSVAHGLPGQFRETARQFPRDLVQRLMRKAVYLALVLVQ